MWPGWSPAGPSCVDGLSRTCARCTGQCRPSQLVTYTLGQAPCASLVGAHLPLPTPPPRQALPRLLRSGFLMSLVPHRYPRPRFPGLMHPEHRALGPSSQGREARAQQTPFLPGVLRVDRASQHKSLLPGCKRAQRLLSVNPGLHIECPSHTWPLILHRLRPSHLQSCLPLPPNVAFGWCRAQEVTTDTRRGPEDQPSRGQAGMREHCAHTAPPLCLGCRWWRSPA